MYFNPLRPNTGTASFILLILGGCAVNWLTSKTALVVTGTKGGKVRATNQCDNQSITLLTAFCNQQMARERVSKSGQGKDSTAIKNPSKRNAEQTRVSQQVRCQGKLIIGLFIPIAIRHWSKTYQRLTKTIKGGGVNSLKRDRPSTPRPS